MRRTGQEDPPTTSWSAETLRNPHLQPDKAARIEAMFDAIAPVYERFNTLATFGLDARWRRRAVAAAAVRADDVVLDICCGTGDMIRTFAAARPAPRLILGLDFSAGMLARCRVAGLPTEVALLRGDALQLPLADESVDVISCAFGVRNFRDVALGFGQMFRVARPGGRVVVLEFALPDHALLRPAYGFYCDQVLPRLAALLSRDRTGAYRYLPRSIRTFAATDTMVRQLELAGFGGVELQRMNFGGVVLYRGVKSRGAARADAQGRRQESQQERTR